jgi:hypothetical protein
MSNVTTKLPPFSKTVRVEAEIPVSQRDEFDRAMVEIIAGERSRALDRDLGRNQTSRRRGTAINREGNQ